MKNSKTSRIKRANRITNNFIRDKKKKENSEFKFERLKLFKPGDVVYLTVEDDIYQGSTFTYSNARRHSSNSRVYVEESIGYKVLGFYGKYLPKHIHMDSVVVLVKEKTVSGTVKEVFGRSVLVEFEGISAFGNLLEIKNLSISPGFLFTEMEWKNSRGSRLAENLSI